MAALQPVDAGQLLRKLTADIGRPPTPADAQLLALALRHLADGIVQDTRGPQLVSWGTKHREDGYCCTSSAELRQLARQLLQTAGLAEAIQHGPEGRCGALAKLGDPTAPVVVQCVHQLDQHPQRPGGAGPVHQSRAGVNWTDDDPHVVGF